VRIQKLVEEDDFYARRNAVINATWIDGKGKMLPLTTLRTAILLRRNLEDARATIIEKLVRKEAVEYIENVDFCNLHLPVKDPRENHLRRRFFKSSSDALKSTS
jgi:hypothetical protein